MKTNTELFAIAKSQLGNGGAKYRKYVGIGKGQPYCDAFVFWLYDANGCGDQISPCCISQICSVAPQPFTNGRIGVAGVFGLPIGLDGCFRRFHQTQSTGGLISHNYSPYFFDFFSI